MRIPRNDEMVKLRPITLGLTLSVVRGRQRQVLKTALFNELVVLWRRCSCVCRCFTFATPQWTTSTNLFISEGDKWMRAKEREGERLDC